MSSDNTDVQRFDRDGTWVKPRGAVRVELAICHRGGDLARGQAAIADRIRREFGRPAISGGGGGASLHGAGGRGGDGGSYGQAGQPGQPGTGPGGGAGGAPGLPGAGVSFYLGSTEAERARRNQQPLDWRYIPAGPGEDERVVWVGAEMPAEITVQVRGGDCAIFTTYLG